MYSLVYLTMFLYYWSLKGIGLPYNRKLHLLTFSGILDQNNVQSPRGPRRRLGTWSWRWCWQWWKIRWRLEWGVTFCYPPHNDHYRKWWNKRKRPGGRLQPTAIKVAGKFITIIIILLRELWIYGNQPSGYNQPKFLHRVSGSGLRLFRATWKGIELWTTTTKSWQFDKEI